MKMKRFCLIAAVLLALNNVASAQPANDNVVVTTPPTSTVQGKQAVKPALGTGGHGTTFNFLPYIVPGQFSNPVTNVVENDPFDVAYINRSQPVQTSDWWTGIGLQWIGWVGARKVEEGQIGRSNSFITEPFHMRFVDIGPGVNNNNAIPGIPLLVHGLRFWNQNEISIKTDGREKVDDPFNPTLNFIGRGNVSTERSPVVTVGLANVHPLGLEVREKAPFSNVKVESYSDWGVVLSYTDAGNKMVITLANGSPFVWMERTQGAAPFTVWAGDRNEAGARTVWYNQGGVIGVTVTNAYNPFVGLPESTSTAAYVIIADQGNWGEQVATGEAISMFTNSTATRVVVLAMPHNINPSDANALIAAMNDLRQYACRKVVNTKIHYPPIAGSDASVTVGQQNLTLGYDEKNSLIRLKLEVTTAALSLPGCNGAGSLQMVFPHHRKTMIEAHRQNIAPQYTWKSLKGELQAYKGDSYVREVRTRGTLPFMPSAAINSSLQNPLRPPQLAVDDIYTTMTNWFFSEEPQPNGAGGVPQHLDSFVRNLGTYVGVQFNTYIQGVAALYESLVIADQLSRSTVLSGNDPKFGRAKTAIAAEMRDVLLQSLKELIGNWGDVYTSQFFQYNSEYNTLVGFPEGYASTQNINDHHFHYGYFLKALAMIGRYDRVWFNQYLPLINELRRDVATYDRSDAKYPFLREFSPFYGHSFANGTADGGGNDQESTSEAINFAAGLLELGQVTANKDWRDLGMYLYEEEILATEQYWFNQEADLTKSSGTFYNGNWPDSFVRFTGPDGTPWNTTIIAINAQYALFRFTFGGGGIAATHIIQELPLSASSLYLGRNHTWLQAMWDQYVRESKGAPLGVYEVLVSGLQARLPGSGTTTEDPGLAGALQRIERLHNFFLGSTNTMGKYWAYTNAQLGQLDSGFVADTASYAVFKKGSNRSFVAYNPTDTAITVTFTELVGGGKTMLQVPGFSMATRISNDPVIIDELSPPINDTKRLYLQPSRLLTATPGTFTLPAGQTPFPTDASRLAPSLLTIPVRSDQDGRNPNPPSQQPPFPPRAADMITWTGTFSGALDGTAPHITRFSIYMNPNPFPGWQQDPSKGGNTMTLRFVYDFDADGVPDRIEVLQNAPLFTGNAFLYNNKLTEYYGDNYIKGPLGDVSLFLGGPDSQGIIRYMAPYPSVVQHGILTVQIYGGSNINTQFLHPFSVSVGASPLTNRASWVRPPYETRFQSPPPPECTTLCFSSPDYYLNNLNRLPKGAVIIRGVNLNAPVSTGNTTQMRQALNRGDTPNDRFNRQYVAAQLSLLAAPGSDQGALQTRLECFGLDFAPFVLDSGVTLTPKAKLDSVMDEARRVARGGSSSDLALLTSLLDLINDDGLHGRCAP